MLNYMGLLCKVLFYYISIERPRRRTAIALQFYAMHIKMNIKRCINKKINLTCPLLQIYF